MVDEVPPCPVVGVGEFPFRYDVIGYVEESGEVSRTETERHQSLFLFRVAGSHFLNEPFSRARAINIIINIIFLFIF